MLAQPSYAVDDHRPQFGLPGFEQVIGTQPQCCRNDRDTISCGPTDEPGHDGYWRRKENVEFVGQAQEGVQIGEQHDQRNGC